MASKSFVILLVMSLQEQITNGWKDAMRAGDALRKDTLSSLRAAIKNAEIETRSTDAATDIGSLDDEGVLKVIEREAKKRRDAMEEYEKAGRPERVESERAELQILQEFLPAQFSEAELEVLAREAIVESGASTAKDMGNVMKVFMPRVQGRADGKAASAAVKKLLG
jgi:uncharacterized protein YqeY